MANSTQWSTTNALVAGNAIEQSSFWGNRIAATVDGGAFEPGDNEFDANTQ